MFQNISNDLLLMSKAFSFNYKDNLYTDTFTLHRSRKWNVSSAKLLEQPTILDKAFQHYQFCDYKHNKILQLFMGSFQK